MANFDEIGEKLYLPQRIEYFIKNGIKIIDIHCGQSHAMIMDENGNVYSFGDNYEAQCGISSDIRIVTKPTLIESMSKYNIETIKIGDSHSVFKTLNNAYYIFGSNRYGQCFGSLFQENISDEIVTPIRIDVILKEKYNIKSIIDIIPGFFNTVVICQQNN